MIKKLKHDNRGAATIMALIVSAVLTVFCLALLLVSYTLFISAEKSKTREKCKTMVISLTKELQSEITNVDFESYSAQVDALKNNKDGLWFYLRYNIGQNSWPYYRDEDALHNHTYADRSFYVNSTDGNEMKNVTVTMYWTINNALDGEDSEQRQDIELYVTVECKMGGQKYSLTTSYNLENDGSYDIDSLTEDKGNSAVNPDNNSITSIEKWVWRFDERGDFNE